MPHPVGGSLGWFRVVFGLPCAGSFAQNFPLAANLDLTLAEFGQERTPAPLAYDLVDICNQVNRQDYVCSPVCILLHTYSVTYAEPFRV